MSKFINVSKDVSSIINKYLINKENIKSEYKKNVMYLKLIFGTIGIFGNHKPSHFQSHNKWFITIFEWNSKFWKLKEEKL